MKCAIHQPNYLPWMGYFRKIHQADVFVFLDDAQYTKNSFINRNKMMANGVPTWLTVPIFTNGRNGQTIRETQIDYKTGWKRKHWKTLLQYYKKTPCFGAVSEQLRGMYNAANVPTIDRLNAMLIQQMAIIMGISTRFTFSSMLGIQSEGTQRLIDICRAKRCDTYISGRGADNYMDTDAFERAGIRIEWQDMPVKDPTLSALHYLFTRKERGNEIFDWYSMAE